MTDERRKGMVVMKTEKKTSWKINMKRGRDVTPLHNNKSTI